MPQMRRDDLTPRLALRPFARAIEDCLRLCVNVFSVSLLLAVCAACIPAETPAVLLNTPGPPVTITGDQVITTTFAVRYPSGWRVITSEASAPPTVTLVAPDDCTIIVVSVGSIDPTGYNVEKCGAAAEPLRQSAELPGVTVRITAVGSTSDPVALQDAFSAVFASLDAPSAGTDTPQEG